jgi:hypothetical protein
LNRLIAGLENRRPERPLQAEGLPHGAQANFKEE